MEEHAQATVLVMSGVTVSMDGMELAVNICDAHSTVMVVDASPITILRNANVHMATLENYVKLPLALSTVRTVEPAKEVMELPDGANVLMTTLESYATNQLVLLIVRMEVNASKLCKDNVANVPLDGQGHSATNLNAA